MRTAVWAFDLGVRMGVAKGEPRENPWSATVELKKRGENIDVAFGNLLAFLNESWNPALGGEIPRIVAVEAVLNLAAFAPKKGLDGQMKHFTSVDNVIAHYGFHAILRTMCQRFGVRHEPVHDATVRKHFLGRGKLGSREETKHAVITRCYQLGYMPHHKYDNNRADALAVWDWVCATHCRAPPRELHFFQVP